MAVHHHVYHIIKQHHLIEWFRPGEEILLEVITEVFKNTLENIVGTNERGYIITLIQTDRYLIYIFRNRKYVPEGIVSCVAENYSEFFRGSHILVAATFLVSPVVGIRKFLKPAQLVQYLIGIFLVHARVICKQNREDIIVLVPATYERSAELDALVYGRATRYHLVLEDALQLYVLYLRVEGSVVDIEGRGDISLVLCRENNLPTLGEILAVFDAYVRSHHLVSHTEGIGIAQYHAVVIACRNIQRGGRFPVIVEERIGTFYLQLGVFAKLVGLSFIQICYFHVQKILFFSKLSRLVSQFLFGVQIRE